MTSEICEFQWTTPHANALVIEARLNWLALRERRFSYYMGLLRHMIVQLRPSVVEYFGGGPTNWYLAVPGVYNLRIEFIGLDLLLTLTVEAGTAEAELRANIQAAYLQWCAAFQQYIIDAESLASVARILTLTACSSNEGANEALRLTIVNDPVLSDLVTRASRAIGQRIVLDRPKVALQQLKASVPFLIEKVYGPKAYAAQVAIIKSTLASATVIVTVPRIRRLLHSVM